MSAHGEADEDLQREGNAGAVLAAMPSPVLFYLIERRVHHSQAWPLTWLCEVSMKSKGRKGHQRIWCYPGRVPGKGLMYAVICSLPETWSWLTVMPGLSSLVLPYRGTGKNII